MSAPVRHIRRSVVGRILLGLSLLFGIRSAWSILLGPVGYQNPDSVMAILEMALYGV